MTFDKNIKKFINLSYTFCLLFRLRLKTFKLTRMETEMVRIADLVYKKITEGLNSEEEAELTSLTSGHPDLEEMMTRLEDSRHVARQLKLREAIRWENQAKDAKRRLGIRQKRWKRWHTAAIAASFIIIISVAVKFFNGSSSPDLQPPAEPTGKTDTQIIRPGITEAFISTQSGEKTTLTTADTSKINLNFPALDKEIHDKNGKPAKSKPLVLDVPRGREFKIILEDSTEVWLNSESQLHYPEHFSAHERRVKIKGEVYFSVKSDKSRPFYVEVRQQQIRVYGTRFNVRSYDDDPITYTTLETGSIAISDATNHGGQLFLSPGNQAMYNSIDGQTEMRPVDPKAIASWRHGRFVFEEQPLKAIMRDLARWYDFKYEFDDPSIEDIVFMGSVPRYADFTTAISILEKSGGIKFEIKGKNVRIHKKKQDSRLRRT